MIYKVVCCWLVARSSWNACILAWFMAFFANLQVRASRHVGLNFAEFRRRPVPPTCTSGGGFAPDSGPVPAHVDLEPTFLMYSQLIGYKLVCVRVKIVGCTNTMDTSDLRTRRAVSFQAKLPIYMYDYFTA